MKNSAFALPGEEQYSAGEKQYSAREIVMYAVTSYLYIVE